MAWLVWFDNNKINLTINIRGGEDIIEGKKGSLR